MKHYILIEMAGENADYELNEVVKIVEKRVGKMTLAQETKEEYSLPFDPLFKHLYCIKEQNVSIMNDIMEDIDFHCESGEDHKLRAVSYLMESEKYNTDYYAGYCCSVFRDVHNKYYSYCALTNCIVSKNTGLFGRGYGVKGKGWSYSVGIGFNILEIPKYEDVLELELHDGSHINFDIFGDWKKNYYYVDRNDHKKGVAHIPREFILKD